MTLEEATEFSKQHHYCICLDLVPVVPLKGERIKPSVYCAVHKTLAERWDSLKSWEEYDAAIAVDVRA